MRRIWLCRAIWRLACQPAPLRIHPLESASYESFLSPELSLEPRSRRTGRRERIDASGPVTLILNSEVESSQRSQQDMQPDTWAGL